MKKLFEIKPKKEEAYCPGLGLRTHNVIIDGSSYDALILEIKNKQ